MLILASTSDLLRVTTGSDSDIEVHASWVDNAAGVITAGRTNTASITSTTTTTVVASPAADTQRNIKHLNITNNHVSASCRVTIFHTDGTNPVELMSFILLPDENMVFSEEGRWTHRDANGAEYPPAGLGAYTGRSVGFMKTGTAADTIGYWYCTSKDAGFPGAWSVGTSGVNGRVTDGTNSSDNGCIPIANPSTGANYIKELQMASSVNHTHLFFDCLWVNNGIVITTATEQVIASPTLPARDINGTTNGEGCMIAVLVTATVGLAAASAAATIKYTNSDGVDTRTATLVAVAGAQAPTTPLIGTIIWFSLAAGDKGVRSIQGITLGASWISGSISVMICRDISTIGTTIPNVSAQKIIGDPGIRLYNNSCVLHCVQASATTATFFSGELTIMEK